MSHRETGVVDFAAALALGALLGAGLALYFGSRSGGSLRKDVAKKSRTLHKRGRRWTRQTSTHLGKSGARWWGETEKKAGDVGGQISEAVEEGVASIRKAVAEELKHLDKRMGRRKRRIFG
ncbi:MAG: hypothetical protein ABR559_07565 [Gemmatimonadota bacterium]